MSLYLLSYMNFPASTFKRYEIGKGNRYNLVKFGLKLGSNFNIKVTKIESKPEQSGSVRNSFFRHMQILVFNLKRGTDTG